MQGRPVLDSPIGSLKFVTSFVKGKVEEWITELTTLSQITDSQPHASFAALTRGLYSKWNYLARTTPALGDLLQSLEDAIRIKILSKQTGRELPNDQERCLFALPSRVGGLKLLDPATFTVSQYHESVKVSGRLSDLILTQSTEYKYETLSKQLSAKSDIKRRRRQLGEEAAAQLKHCLSAPLQKSMYLNLEKGASSWLTVLPLEEHRFALHKQAFRDALAGVGAFQVTGSLLLWSTLLGPTRLIKSKRRLPIDLTQ